MPLSGAEALRGPVVERCLRKDPGEGKRAKIDSSERPSDTLMKPAPLHRWHRMGQGH
jgi:hypothetical protein